MPTLHQGLVARAEQRLALLPRMLQSIEILQLATVDLIAMIDAELERNETLELVRPAEPIGRGAGSSGDDHDVKQELLAQTPDRAKDLWTHVRDEIGVLDLTDDLERCVLELVGCLDARGYLGDGVADLVARRGDAAVAAALDVLHRIEPRGLGARGPVEAMLLQLADHDPDRPALEAILSEHLEALAQHRNAEVARRLEVEVDELEQLLEKVARLDPRPGARFTAVTAPGIRPDVVVRSVEGRLEVAVDELALPVIGVDEEYQRMASDRATPREVRRYLGGKLRSARELIDAVESRKRTLCEVTAAILAENRSFLRHGRRAIRPLGMADVAARLGLHPSTVSRAIAGKHLGHPGGVIALREFFDGGRAVDGASRGRTALRELVREAVAGEDPRAPLSDDALRELLAAQGLRIARRTVAKYRAELGIPPVAVRRRRAGGRPR